MQAAARDYQLAQDAMEVLSNSDMESEEDERDLSGLYNQPFCLPAKQTREIQNFVKDDAVSCEHITFPLCGKNLNSIIVKVRTSTLDEERKNVLEETIKTEATRLLKGFEISIKGLETYANQKFEEKKYEQMRNDQNEMKRLKKELTSIRRIIA